ncbi:MBL fold metallo-hydrolase [Frankia sp. R82]|uniref:MBL fold metallo-hydrolase n=1 Tax=Frankia sp. R82 TaxID=2950553 RepID=UPI0035AB828C
MTLAGTNTWLLRAPGQTGVVVVDPGPDDPVHLAAVAAAGPVELILLTHGHADHSGGAVALHRHTGAPVRALDCAHRLGDEGLTAGDVIARPGFELRVLPTPGHTADSLSFLLTGDDAGAHDARTDAAGPDHTGTGTDRGRAALAGRPAVLTGDTILGQGSTVVAHPDGRLGDYLDSLRLLQELGETTVLPGHGPELPAAGTAARHYLAHRHARLAQVRAALAEAGVAPAQADAAAVVRQVYADTDRALWPAAELSVRAQLAYLREHPTLP